MKIVHTEGNFKTLAFARGEEIMSGLEAYMQAENVTAAHLTGLGAADVIEIAYYNLASKEYERHTIEEELEILSLNGNVGVKEGGALVVHVHGVFGKKDLSVIGGHVFSMRVSGTAEIHVRTFEGAINRSYDSVTGLTTMCTIE